MKTAPNFFSRDKNMSFFYKKNYKKKKSVHFPSKIFFDTFIETKNLFNSN